MMNSIITADCIPAMVSMKAGGVDLIVTSPPYPGQKADTRSVDEWLAWMSDVTAQMRRVLKQSGVLVFNVMFKRLESGFYDTRVMTAVPVMLASAGFNMIDVYPYVNPNPAPNGPLKYADIPAWEYVFICTPASNVKDFVFNPQRRPYSPKSVSSNGELYTSRPGRHKRLHQDGARQSNVLIMSSSGDQNRPKAKGQSFPRKFAERFILQYTSAGDAVLDPFTGVGTVCKEAQRLGRRWIGIEMDGGEAQVARDWLAEPYQVQLL